MGVVVHNMKMPRSCLQCQLETEDAKCSICPEEETNYVRRPERCPLEEYEEEEKTAEGENTKLFGAASAILLFILTLVICFLVVAVLTRIFCWGFGRVWNWKVAIGSYVFMFLVVTVMKLGREL